MERNMVRKDELYAINVLEDVDVVDVGRKSALDADGGGREHDPRGSTCLLRSLSEPSVAHTPSSSHLRPPHFSMLFAR